MGKYVMLVDRALHGEICALVGEVVHDARGPDYGLVADDERICGIPHKLVTKNPNKWEGAFTVPCAFIREI